MMIDWSKEPVDLFSPTASSVAKVICARRLNAAAYLAYITQMRAAVYQASGAVPAGYPTGAPTEYASLVRQFCPELMDDGNQRKILLWVGVGAAAFALFRWIRQRGM